MPNLPLNISHDPESRRAYSMHARGWQNNRYVYPVVSRRSKGISVGINLNPDKVCNFDCIYCSVDRRVPPQYRQVDIELLRRELSNMLASIHSGDIFNFDPFDKIPHNLRRLNDIAFSGDGEPTTFADFPAACRLAADLKNAAALHHVKLVLITNATMFQRPQVRDALAFLDQHQGEIWAKLDAGTPEYYDLVDRTPVPFSRVLENLLWCCQTRPTVIQSLFMRVHGVPPPLDEITAYAEQLAHIVAQQGTIKLIQLYTVARTTTEPYATALTQQELENIQQHVHHRLPTTTIEVYP